VARTGNEKAMMLIPTGDEDDDSNP